MREATPFCIGWYSIMIFNLALPIKYDSTDDKVTMHTCLAHTTNDIIQDSPSSSIFCWISLSIALFLSTKPSLPLPNEFGPAAVGVSL
jgi:hypothetical protein